MLHLRAPAKLNLYLRVLGRRPDGYHEIETLFERIDLADEMTFEPASSGISLICDDPTLSCGEDNLIVEAARLLQQGCRTTQGVRIHLTKRIPIAAGLGGGSSDAASTLVGLNDLWDLHLEPPMLLRLAAELGSDVPFFLAQAPFALGRGRGEVCEPLTTAPRLSHVLVVPDARLSTREVYEGFDLPPPPIPTVIQQPQTRRGQTTSRHRSDSRNWWGGLTASKPSITMLVHALSNGSLGELASGLWNDLEPEAIRRCPPITLIQTHLRDLGCVSACVSGSGPSVFGLCRDTAHAREVAVQLGRRAVAASWRIEISHTENPSHVVAPSLR